MFPFPDKPSISFLQDHLFHPRNQVTDASTADTNSVLVADKKRTFTTAKISIFVPSCPLAYPARHKVSVNRKCSNSICTPDGANGSFRVYERLPFYYTRESLGHGTGENGRNRAW